MPSNVLPLRLKQTFPPIVWIFTEGEGDGMEFRLFFKKICYFKDEPIVERKQNGKKSFVCVQLANFFSAAKREKPTAT